MLGVNQPLLARLASQTGGRVVTSANDAAGLRAILQREPGQAGAADTAWRLFLLVGLILFFFDIAVRRVVVPEGLGAKVAARLRGLRPVAGPGYEDLAGLVRKAHEEERQKLRRRIAGQSREGSLDSDLAAYLYIARLHSKRAEKEEKR
jgi:hypothetical protein